MEPARRPRGSTPVATITAAAAVHTAAKASTGRTRRRRRLPSHVPYVTPLRWAAAREAELEKPPTMKNTGMTWKIHVSQRADGVVSRTLAVCSRPSAHTTTAISQWPSITTMREATRRKST